MVFFSVVMQLNLVILFFTQLNCCQSCNYARANFLRPQCHAASIKAWDIKLHTIVEKDDRDINFFKGRLFHLDRNFYFRCLGESIQKKTRCNNSPAHSANNLIFNISPNGCPSHIGTI